MTIDDIDLVEINEAFAAQVHPVVPTTSASTSTSSTSTAARSPLGHPFGMTGARITTTLLNGLAVRATSQFGLETMCVGGGQGMAMIVERLS